MMVKDSVYMHCMFIDMPKVSSWYIRYLDLSVIKNKASYKKTYPSWPKAIMDALCNCKKKWYLYKNSQDVKKVCSIKNLGWKRCKIKGGSQEMVVMVANF